MTVEVILPDNLELTPKEVLTGIAAQLYGRGKLSLGQAADVAGLDKTSFMNILGNYDVSVFNHPIEELESDLKNARSYNC